MRRFSLVTMVLIGSCLGCGSGSKDTSEPGDKVEFQCVLGEHPDEGGFVSFTDESTAELILGFQGFLFLQVFVEGSRASSGPYLATTSISLDGEAVGATQPDILFDSRGESGEVLVFLPTANIASFLGMDADLAVRLEGSGFFCVTTAEVTLVDDDPCIHTDDEPICPDDTGVYLDTGVGIR